VERGVVPLRTDEHFQGNPCLCARSRLSLLQLVRPRLQLLLAREQPARHIALRESRPTRNEGGAQHQTKTVSHNLLHYLIDFSFYIFLHLIAMRNATGVKCKMQRGCIAFYLHIVGNAVTLPMFRLFISSQI
jgi:hypothetical protein